MTRTIIRRSYLWFLVCLLLLGSCAGAPKPEERWRKQYQDGVRAREQGNLDRAEAKLLGALGSADEMGAADLRTSMILVELGDLYATLGRDTDAGNSFRQAVAIQEQVLGHDHLQVAATLERLARVLRRESRYEESVAALERALAIRDNAETIITPAVAATLEDLAVSHAMAGRYRQAIPFLERSLTIREAVVGPNDPSVVRTLGHLAEAHQQLGNDEGLFFSLSRSLRVMSNELAPVDSLMAAQIRAHGDLLAEKHLALFTRRTSRRQTDAKSPPAGSAGKSVTAEQEEEAVRKLLAGVAKLAAGRFDLAAKDFESAHPNLPRDDELRNELVKGYGIIGMEYYSDGRLEDAIHVWERALAVDPKNEQINSYLVRIRKSMKKAKEIAPGK
ncbi:MAG: tetratricopeptide repeat protein [Gemmatimonadetes bacterium]|nr:tetratricopeptide repeat protein [Gemmatimonadota bacterium]